MASSPNLCCTQQSVPFLKYKSHYVLFCLKFCNVFPLQLYPIYKALLLFPLILHGLPPKVFTHVICFPDTLFSFHLHLFHATFVSFSVLNVEMAASRNSYLIYAPPLSVTRLYLPVVPSHSTLYFFKVFIPFYCHYLFDVCIPWLNHKLKECMGQVCVFI